MFKNMQVYLCKSILTVFCCSFYCKSQHYKERKPLIFWISCLVSTLTVAYLIHPSCSLCFLLNFWLLCVPVINIFNDIELVNHVMKVDSGWRWKPKSGSLFAGDEVKSQVLNCKCGAKNQIFIILEVLRRSV